MKRVIQKYGYAMLLRYAVLGGLLAYITYNGYMHQQHESKYPSVDALCPFGALESFYSLVFHGQYLDRVLSSSVVLLIVIVSLALVSGRSFCGWICPMGTLQGITGWLGRIFIRKERIISASKDKKVRWMRYVILAFFTIGAWYGGKLLIRPYDPWAAWMHISEFDHAIEGFLIGTLILFVVLLLAIFIPRIFCRYLCPMGGILGIISRLSIGRITRNEGTCIQCGLCDRNCPVGIDVSKSLAVSKIECIYCGECVSVCPVRDTMSFGFANRYILSSLSLGFTVLILFFGTITVTQATGLYSSKYPSVNEYKQSGEFKPEMIKGYMTLEDVAYLFDLEITTLYEQLDLDPQMVPQDTKCKEISDIVDRKFNTDIVRVGVGALLEIPTSEIPASCSPSDSAGGFIYGTMTLAEVSTQFNIPLDVLYKELGIDMTDVSPDTQCRDLKHIVSPDFHTSVVREAMDRILQSP